MDPYRCVGFDCGEGTKGKDLLFSNLFCFVQFFGIITWYVFDFIRDTHETVSFLEFRFIFVALKSRRERIISDYGSIIRLQVRQMQM